MESPPTPGRHTRRDLPKLRARRCPVASHNSKSPCLGGVVSIINPIEPAVLDTKQRNHDLQRKDYQRRRSM